MYNNPLIIWQKKTESTEVMAWSTQSQLDKESLEVHYQWYQGEKTNNSNWFVEETVGEGKEIMAEQCDKLVQLCGHRYMQK